MRQELLTLLDHLSSSPVFSCVHVTQSLFVLFPLTIVLSALLLFMNSDYSVGIFKLFFYQDFSYIIGVHFNGERNPSTLKKKIDKVYHIRCY